MYLYIYVCIEIRICSIIQIHCEKCVSKIYKLLRNEYQVSQFEVN